ncbi:MAG: hypothetical protein KF824_01565 [Fimbriimonadaceae bacterium]|nr:MAG: hypothetical protein KF824_01565 [Fimbriimonadaceae bacterium]
MASLSPHLEQLNFEFIDQSSKAVYRNGWQDSGGVRPYADAIGVLKNLLRELIDAEKQGLVDEFPIGTLQDIQSHLQNIWSHMTNLISGNNHVASLVDEIDRLHQKIWQGGFRYRGKKIVGYEQKYKQISQLSAEIEKIKQRESDAEEILSTIREISEEIAELDKQLQLLSNSIESKVTKVDTLHSKAIDAEEELDSQLENVDSLIKMINDNSNTAQAKAETAATSEKRLQDFLSRVDENEQKLAEAIQKVNEFIQTKTKEYSDYIKDSSTDVDKFKEQSQDRLIDLLERMEIVELDIHDKLRNATGISLFHAFEEKRKWSLGHVFWLLFAVGAAGSALYITTVTLEKLAGQPMDAVAYIKIALSLPAILLAGFALGQYGRERRLREEYAFKSKISLSLEVYRELVEEAVDTLTPEDKAKFADFLINSVGIIFESPTERVFGQRRLGGPTDTKVISSFLKNAKDAADLMQGK